MGLPMPPERITLLENKRIVLGVTGSIAAYKAVLLEGVEVVFIVLATGAGQGMIGYASLGALAACILVLLIG